MKCCQTRRLLSPILVAVFAFAGIIQPAAAQDAGPAAGVSTKPVVVLTLGSFNKLMRDVNYITAAVGQPGAGGLFAMYAGSMANGLDMDRPIGVLVPLVDGMPQPLALLPTDNVKKMLSRMEAQLGPADELSDGTLVIAINMQTVYIKQAGDWAVVSNNRDALKLAPADPDATFKDIGEKYFLYVRLRLQEIPADMRSMMIGQMRQGFEQAMAQNPDGAQAREMAEGSLDQFEQLINESDELNFALDVNQSSRFIQLLTSFKAVPGSELSRLYKDVESAPSKFASVIRPDAAMYLHASQNIPPAMVEATRESVGNTMQMFEGMLESAEDLSETQREDINEMLGRIIKLSMKSMEEGRSDAGALLLAGEDQGRFVFGSRVADGNEAASIVKDFADKIKDETDAPEFFFDVETYNGVTLHRVEAEVPADKDEARQIFGDKLEVHIGTGPKSMYAAIGKNSLALMKELIDAPEESAAPAGRPTTQMIVKMQPMLEFADNIEASPPVTAMLSALEKADEPGMLRMVVEPIPNGNVTKITVSEGMLKALGAAAAAGQNGNEF
ncbi:MAG: hypothetical protein AAF958_06845 [Planctomycetota bacterium]